MPNPGGVYRGCGMCRTRKVKCDQTFPSCTRCQKARLQCPGVLAATEAMFRDETAKFVRKSSRPRVPRDSSSSRRPASGLGECVNPLLVTGHIASDFSSPSGQPDGFRDESLVSSIVLSTRPASLSNFCTSAVENDRHHESQVLETHQRTPKITQEYGLPTNSPPFLRQVVLSTAQIMTQYFFEQIVMSGMWLSMLPDLYSLSHDQDSIRHAIEAASLFLLANQSDDRGALEAARGSYSRCLRLLNLVLANSSDRLKDETLCTILILHLVNDIAGERSMASGSHLKACKTLLLQRDLSAANTRQIANSLVIQSQAYVLKNYEDWADLYEEHICSCASATPASKLLHYCSAVGKLKTNIKTLSKLHKRTTSDVDNMWLDSLQEAKNLDRDLQGWESTLLGRWRRNMATYNLSRAIEVTMDYYHDFQVGKVWNQYRCVRIALQEVIIDIIGYLGVRTAYSHNESSRVFQQAVQVITTMLSGICDSIPFHMQRIDSKGELVEETTRRILGGEHLLWPLDVVLHSPWSSDAQRGQVRKVLEEIGSRMGLRQAQIFLQHEKES